MGFLGRVLVGSIMLGAMWWGDALALQPYTPDAFEVLEITPPSGVVKYSGDGGYPLTDAIVEDMNTRTSGGSSTVKTKVGALKATGQVIVRYAPAVLGAVAKSTLMGVAISIGTSVIGNYIADWLAEEGYTNDGGTIKKPGTSTEWRTSSAAGQVGRASIQLSGYGTVSMTMSGPSDACPTQGYWTNVGFVSSPSVLNWSYAYWEGCVMTTGMNPTYRVRPRSGYASWVEPVPAPLVAVDLSELVATFQAALEANSAAAEKAYGAALALLAGYVNESSKQFPAGKQTSPAGSPSISPTQLQTVKDQIASGVAQAVKDVITAGSDTPRQIGDDWEFTPDQLAEANGRMLQDLEKKAIADYDAQGVTVPGVTEPSAEPEKKSLTEVLNNQTGQAQETDLYGKLQDLKETSFNNPVCSIATTLGPWGTVTFSLCEWQSVLNMLGSMMLMVAGFGWTLWLFMGRGDA